MRDFVSRVLMEGMAYVTVIPVHKIYVHAE